MSRCGSSIEALIMGCQAIKAEDVDTVLAGGTESANNVPYGLAKARWGYRMGKGAIDDLLHKDGFLCPTAGGLMGQLTDVYAKDLGISREEQDAFAADSHNKTEAAVASGAFEAEIVPIEVPGRKGATIFKGRRNLSEGCHAGISKQIACGFHKRRHRNSRQRLRIVRRGCRPDHHGSGKSQRHGIIPPGTGSRIFLCGL